MRECVMRWCVLIGWDKGAREIKPKLCVDRVDRVG